MHANKRLKLIKHAPKYSLYIKKRKHYKKYLKE